MRARCSLEGGGQLLAANSLLAGEKSGEKGVRTRRIQRYRGTSLIRNRPLLGPFSRAMPGALWWSLGGGAVFHEPGTPVLTRSRTPRNLQYV